LTQKPLMVIILQPEFLSISCWCRVLYSTFGEKQI